MKFHYKARSADGQFKEGDSEAADKFALAAALKKEGQTVYYAEESGIAPKQTVFERINAVTIRVNTRDKIVFFKNFGAMLEAGLPLTRALSIFIRQAQNQKLRRVLETISVSVGEGSSLHDAMKRFSPTFFSPLSVAMIKAGEESGKLPDALKIISAHMEESDEIERRVRGALMYPLIVVGAMIGVGVLMFMYVVPALVSTFTELNVELPASTKIIILLSRLFSEYSLVSLVGFVALVASAVIVGKTPRGKRFFEIVWFAIPLVGELVRKVNSARTARTLSSLLASGISMVEALHITSEVVQNLHYRAALEYARDEVQKGTQLSQIFKEYGNIYPLFVGEMTAVGEETGKLSEMLVKTADFYEADVSDATKNLSTVIEPLLMVVIGMGVGFFAYSMITPLYTVMSGI